MANEPNPNHTFKDLLEIIHDITTPYEYDRFKKIYENKKDLLTLEEQKFIEAEYKKKKDVLNNTKKKVKDGAIIITIGIDLTNDRKISDINFEKFKKYIAKEKEIQPIDKQISFYFISSFNRYWSYFPDKDFDKNIREYVIDVKKNGEKNEIDINLLYLFSRKNTQLTDKGRKGFIHIRFFNKDLNFYEIEELEPVSFPIEYDESYEKAYIPNENNVKEKIANVKKTYIAKVNKGPFKANIKGYLHVDLNEEKGTISRAATVTFVIEHFPKNDKFDYDYFLRHVRDFYIEWEEKEIENDTENICKDKFIRKVQIQDNDKKEIKEAEVVTFYDFLFLTIWNKIIYPTRKNIYKAKINKESLNPNMFLEKIRRESNFIIFEHSVLVFDKVPELENYKIQEYPDYFIEDLLDFFGGIEHKEYVKSDIEEFKENAFVAKTALFYESYGCIIIGRDIAKMEDFYNNKINPNEPGTRWAISWAILFGDMATTSATYFILYNSEIEEHLSKEESMSELKEITRKAIFDFEYYYDVDIINDPFLRDVFEKIKNTFKLNYYHKVLQDRLQLFSSHEIADETKKLTTVLIFLTVIIVIVEGLLLIPVYGLWRTIISLVGITLGLGGLLLLIRQLWSKILHLIHL
jgi:hypothetical protein